MNLLLKSSILTLLSASLSSSANANICVETGQNAAELVILNNWCQPFASATSSYPTAEERCRDEAIDICRDRDTLRGIIDDWCPDTRPRNSDINNLRGYCRSTVDGLIGWTPAPTRRPTRPPTRRPTPAPVPPTVESGFRAGQDAMRQWWVTEGESDCSNAWSGIINPVANDLKNKMFPNSGSSSTRAFNQAGRNGVDSEVAKIQDECFSDVSVVRALRGNVE